MFMCSCNEGYEGAYCQVTITSTSELPLLISLSTLLPIAAILVVIVTIIFVYRRLRARQVVDDTRRHRNNLRTKYDASMCIITQRRSVAKSVGCFQRRLFVCQHDNVRTSKHRMMKLGGR